MSKAGIGVEDVRSGHSNHYERESGEEVPRRYEAVNARLCTVLDTTQQGNTLNSTSSLERDLNFHSYLQTKLKNNQAGYTPQSSSSPLGSHSRSLAAILIAASTF